MQGRVAANITFVKCNAGIEAVPVLHLDELYASLRGKVLSLKALSSKTPKCVVLSIAQVKAQAEVVARAARDKLHSLPSGDYEETDEELERFAADFEQVGSVARQISCDSAPHGGDAPCGVARCTVSLL